MKSVKICEICKNDKVPLEKHHIQSKKYNGSNNLWNIAFICPLCHSDCHKGQYIIEGKFMSSKSKVLIWRKSGEESITGLPDPQVVIVKRKGEE